MALLCLLGWRAVCFLYVTCCVSYDCVASTEATVTGLSASQSYELLLLAGRDGETEQVGVRMTATTSSSENTADNSGAILTFF